MQQYTCCGCGRREKKAEMKEVGWLGVRTEWLCVACAAEYAFCPTCRMTRRRGEMKDGYCTSCLALSKVLRRGIQRADLKIVPKFIGEAPWYGVELEVDRIIPTLTDLMVKVEDFRRAQCALELGKLQKKCGELFFIKDDGSLDGGFEIVSHPHSVVEWDKQEWLKEACQIVKDHGGGSFNTRTCGLHVHRSRMDLSDLYLSNMIVLFIRLQPFLEKVAQRRENGYCKYAFFLDKDWGSGRLNGKVLYKSIKEKKGSAVSRYQALNLYNPDTIECRIFRGTLIESSIRGYIHFMHMLTEFSKDRRTQLGKLLRYSVSDLWKLLYDFVAIDPVVKNYLDMKNITEKGEKASKKVVPYITGAESEEPFVAAQARALTSTIGS